MQQVTLDIRDTFVPVEKSIQNTFILDLFQGVRDGTLGRGVTRLSVKHAGISLPYPTRSATDNWMASNVNTGHLAAALGGQEELITADHSAYMREGG